MKNNQFARLEVDLPTAIQELTAIHAVDQALLATTAPIDRYAALLQKSFPEAKSERAIREQWQGLLATPEQDLAQYLKEANQLPVSVFYRVALQLLGFQPDLDFDLHDPLAAMATIQLPVVSHQTDHLSADDLLAAWYLLLTTHTKNGQTYLDYLATKGFFVPLIADATTPKPLFFNGKAQPVFATDQLRRDVVYVESPQDTDGDGQRDLLKAEILRPAETDTGLVVPVLLTESPYNQGTNDEAGEQLTHNVNVPLQPKIPAATTLSGQMPSRTVPDPRSIQGQTQQAEQTVAREASYTLNDYFLARGFAVAYSAGIGTKDSDGLRTTGDVEETIATTAIIDWLAGHRPAFTNRTDGIAIEAWWSNHRIAMTGRSYLGTLATAAATTGVDGLKTIISEAAISNWYDYYREGGLVIAPGGFQGEDADVLAEETFSRRLSPADYHRIQDRWQTQLRAIGQGQDRDTGNYNDFWAARNYLTAVKNVTADIVMVHGLNDWNVKPRHVNNLWHALKSVPVAKKLILHQGQHININAFRSVDYTDMMNLWLSYELWGVENHAVEQLPDVLIQDNVTPETWTAYADWDAPTNPTMTFNLQEDQLVQSGVMAPVTLASSFTDQLAAEQFEAYAADPELWQRDLIGPEHNAMFGKRLLFKSNVLAEECLIDGRPLVHLSVAVNQAMGMISAQLIDYGSARRLSVSPTVLARKSLDLGYQWREDDLREFQLAKTTPAKVIARGHINLQNRQSPAIVDELKPNEFYDISLSLQPTFYRLPAGRQLGLVVYATDFDMTVRGNQDLQYSVQLGASTLTIPLHPETPR